MNGIQFTAIVARTYHPGLFRGWLAPRVGPNGHCPPVREPASRREQREKFEALLVAARARVARIEQERHRRGVTLLDTEGAP